VVLNMLDLLMVFLVASLSSCAVLGMSGADNAGDF